jgi:branched-chain amino acid transport system substrate-binding protein
MKNRYMFLCVLAALLVVALATVACGGTSTTTTASTTATTAGPTTESTAAPSTETTGTSGTETTGAPTTATSTAGPATGEPIKIGFSNSLTGDSAAPGASVDKGTKLMFELINAKGGINGRPLQLVEYDDKSDVPTAIANINKMIEQDKVFATIGPFAQYMQEPARQIAEQQHIPMVGTGPATLDQLAGKQYQWSTMYTSAPPAQADAVDKVIKASGWKNILGLGDVLSIDQEILSLLAKNASANGYALTKMADSFPLSQQDFQPLLNKLMDQINTLKPDAVILYVNPLAFPVLYKGLRGLGVTLPILGGTSDAHPAIFALGPQEVEGALIMNAGGNVNPSVLPDSWPVKQLQLDFAKAYKAKYNEDPDFFAAEGADIVILLQAALNNAGAVDRDKLQQALINLKDVPTLEGVCTFTPQATSTGITTNHVEWVVKGGQFEFVRIAN